MKTGALAALGIGATLALVPMAQATSPGTNGRIFFSGRSGCGVASAKVNGTGYNCVDPFGNDPAVSPDDNRIASVRGDVLVEVYGSDINGKGTRRLTHAPGERPSSLSPSFSPDSRQILWFKYGGDSGEDGLYLMDADGSGQRQLTGDGGQDPVFSPSGLQIAYTLGGIAVADGNGGGSHVILRDQNFTTTNPFGHYFEQNREASWAPDGRRLAFARRASTTTIICDPAPPACSGTKTDTATDVFSMNADGTDVRQLTSTPEVDEVDPSYSPDGRMIAYYRLRADRDDTFGEIWVMNADGSGKRRVALGANPEWSTLHGGPGRPRLKFRFHRLNPHRRCLGRLDGWSARVKTTALHFTDFNIAFYVDRRLVNQEFNTRDLGYGVDLTQARRGRTHRLRVVVDDPAVHDRLSRTFKFRRC
jgi:Tol biopolymer transport system component